MKAKPIYKILDDKGRVLIPKSLRAAAEMEHGDIVRLGIQKGVVTAKKVDLIEIGDCFLPDGRYTSGVWLCSIKEVQDYIEMQKDYQHRIMVCDRDDLCVFEMLNGKVVHPLPLLCFF